MQVFKFGGASVKDAEGVRNVAAVLQTVGYDNTLLVVSAMGKTTQALEGVVHNFFENPVVLQSSIQEIKKYHNEILLSLFDDENHLVFSRVDVLFAEMLSFLSRTKSPNYDYVYDQVVCFGELISTTIVHYYLEETGIKNTWLDVRNYIKTDAAYRDSKVDWQTTQHNIREMVDTRMLNVVQGFIASDPNYFTTTLGREGSDYTAAIFAYCLNAGSVTIWKDVPGVLNADPRYFENAKLLHQISYREAIELAFYGASVIHPKTLQPLQQKEIPLHVKSFLNPLKKGTRVSKGNTLEPQLPCFIVKKNQVLLSMSSLDFSFIVEENISEIFKQLHRARMKVDMIQNSAISFSVCVDNKFNTLSALLNALRATFKVDCYENVALYTIRHATRDAVKTVETGKKVLLRQMFQETVQLVVK